MFTIIRMYTIKRGPNKQIYILLNTIYGSTATTKGGLVQLMLVVVLAAKYCQGWAIGGWVVLVTYCLEIQNKYDFFDRTWDIISSNIMT